jgi:hypothetical protein
MGGGLSGGLIPSDVICDLMVVDGTPCWAKLRTVHKLLLIF